jgi:hypothetical protein
MPVTHKYVQPRNLASAATWVMDTDPYSRYFQISRMPEVFTTGKNAFLINGSPELISLSEVLVELTDINGNVVFQQPIRKYLEGTSRLISIEIYSTETAIGMGLLTIMGRLQQDAQGNLPPDKFKNAYNVKWQRRIPIASKQGNDTTIRLYHHPTASVSEALNPFRLISQSMQTVTGSANTALQGISSQPSLQVNSQVRNEFVIVSPNPLFVKEMIGADIMLTLDGYGPFTTSINQIWNNRVADLKEPPVLDGQYFEFTTSDYTIIHSGAIGYTSSEFIKSFAKLHLTQLSSFTGDIYKIKVYVSSIESPAKPELIAELPLAPPEFLSTSSYSQGRPEIRTGYIEDQSTCDNYWVGGLMSSMSLYYSPPTP